MRGNKTVVFNDGMVADVVPTPENDVVPDLNERLDSIVLKDEAVLANFDISPDECSAANVTRQLISFCFCLQT